MLRRDLPPARRTAIKRVLAKRRFKAGPDVATVELVVVRDKGRCVRCGELLNGPRAFGWSVHHRRGRDGKPDSHQPQNLISVCGSDNQSLCHGAIHRSRWEAEKSGLWLSRVASVNPLSVPVLHAVHGRCWLLDDGTVSFEEPT